MRTEFQLPEDVEEHLMAECYAEALDTAGDAGPSAEALAMLFTQKAANYWRSVGRAVH